MHYMAMVVCDDGQGLESLMRRFDENLEVEFYDARIEERDAYESKSLPMLKLKDGSLESRWKDEYVSFDGDFKHIYSYPDGSEEVDVPAKEAFPDFDSYLKAWCGYGEFDGKIGYWHNPDGLWDYWRIGGRWAGSLSSKEGRRAGKCWEVADWEKRQGKEWYGDGQCDTAPVDSLEKDGTVEPYYFIGPDGSVKSHEEWGDFWAECIEPHVGKGCTAYIVDMHD